MADSGKLKIICQFSLLSDFSEHRQKSQGVLSSLGLFLKGQAAVFLLIRVRQVEI